MLYEKMQAMIALTAAIIAAVVSVIKGDDIYAFCVRVAVTALIFFILGGFIKLYLDKKVFKKPQTTEEEGPDEAKGAGAAGADGDDD